MPLLCVMIGFASGILCICFNLEQGKTIRESITGALALSIIIAFAAFGFFTGIKGLCPYLG